MKSSKIELRLETGVAEFSDLSGHKPTTKVADFLVGADTKRLI